MVVYTLLDVFGLLWASGSLVAELTQFCGYRGFGGFWGWKLAARSNQRLILSRLKPVLHYGVVDDSGLLPNELAIREDGEVRNSAHGIAGGQLLIFVGVHFEDD